MRKCVFAGTFDPVTSGHEEIIKKSSNMFDEVVVALCVNVTKRAMFSVEKRLEFLQVVCQKYKNDHQKCRRNDNDSGNETVILY